MLPPGGNIFTNQSRGVVLVHEDVAGWKSTGGVDLLARSRDGKTLEERQKTTGLLQMAALNTMARDCGKALQSRPQTIIMERHFDSNCLFGNYMHSVGLIDDLSFAVWKAHLDAIREMLQAMSSVIDFTHIYIRVSPDVATKQAQKRGYDSDIPLQLNTDLHKAHELLFMDHKLAFPGKIVIIDNDGSPEELQAKIMSIVFPQGCDSPLNVIPPAFDRVKLFSLNGTIGAGNAHNLL